MKALTVRQPWAHHIINGSKRIENRKRRILCRGPLAIHAAQSPSTDASDSLRGTGQPLGVVLGTVDVVGCHLDGDCTGPACTAWGLDGHWHWELANPVAFPDPIPASGNLGLWNWERP